MRSEWEDKAICADAAVRFFNHLDRREYRELAALMDDKGEWHRNGEILTGPDAALSALEMRPASRITRHVVQNLEVNILGDDAKVWYLLSVYLRDRDVLEKSADDLADKFAVVVASDRMHRTTDGWKFTLKTTKPAFA